jgi:hypothetical protein
MWVEHFILDDMVYDVLRTEKYGDYANYYIGALLMNGKI